jgi:hypothetical protein
MFLHMKRKKGNNIYKNKGVEKKEFFTWEEVEKKEFIYIWRGRKERMFLHRKR